jgi:hypothetical protein
MSAIRPTKNTALIVDEFLRYANEHLSTITGVIYTISNYPPLGNPGPGIIQWQGYTVSGFKESDIIEEESFQDVQIENATIDDEFAAKGIPLNESINNPLANESIDASELMDATFVSESGDLPDLTDEEISNFVDEADTTIEVELPTEANKPPTDDFRDPLNGPIDNSDNSGGPMPVIIVDPKKLKQKFMIQTTRVIRELEGGYYHPDMQRKDPVGFKVMGESGETMYGIDRLKGSPATTNPPAAKQFWATIDAVNARKNWKHLYIPPAPLRDTLTYLAASIMEPEFNRMLNSYIKDPNLRKLILSHDHLLFHFIYAAWNGGGWFQGWGRIINAVYKAGTTNPNKLARLMVSKRIDNSGVLSSKSGNNKLIAQGGAKIAKVLGYA